MRQNSLDFLAPRAQRAKRPLRGARPCPRRKGLFNQTTSHLSCYTGMVSYQKFPFDKHIPRADTAKPPYRIANMSHLAAGSGGSSGSSSTQRDMLPIARETKIIRFFFPICFLNSNACEALWDCDRMSHQQYRACSVCRAISHLVHEDPA